MTVAELIKKLQEFPPDTEVQIMVPFDGEGPVDWGTLSMVDPSHTKEYRADKVRLAW